MYSQVIKKNPKDTVLGLISDVLHFTREQQCSKNTKIRIELHIKSALHSFVSYENAREYSKSLILERNRVGKIGWLVVRSCEQRRESAWGINENKSITNGATKNARVPCERKMCSVSNEIYSHSKTSKASLIRKHFTRGSTAARITVETETRLNLRALA